MIFNKKAFFNSKPIKIITELMTTLNEAVDLVEIQSTSNFEDIQSGKDEEFPTNVLKDLIDIDGLKDNIEDKELSNKLLNEGFYPILPPSVYFLNYKNVFISIRSKEIEKEVLAATPVIATKLRAVSLLAATSKLKSD